MNTENMSEWRQNMRAEVGGSNHRVDGPTWEHHPRDDEEEVRSPDPEINRHRRSASNPL